MAAKTNEYHFVSRWTVEGRVDEVADILDDPMALVRWWPSVYLHVEELRAPDDAGLSRRVRVRTKGRLPYVLRWEFEVVESNRPYGFTIAANGDFEGRGVWRFEQQGPLVHIVFDWRILAEKPLLKRLSFLLKPIFKANHVWAMARGEESLARELVRRRGPQPRFVPR